MIQIDNKRMWESILRFSSEVKVEAIKKNPTEAAINFIGSAIKAALKDQGLEYKDGKIVNIESKTELYIALDNVGYYKNSVVGWLPLIAKGEMTTKEKVFHLIPDMTEEKFNKFFRPATEEEIPQTFEDIAKTGFLDQSRPLLLKAKIDSEIQQIVNEHFDEILDDKEEEIKGNNGRITPKFKVGDTIKYVGERRELAADKYTIKDVLTDMYVTTTGTIIPFKFEQHFELVEPEQGNSPTFKELERNGKYELTEFEKMLVSLIRRVEKTVLTPEGLAKEFAPKLIEAVHKQIESEKRLGITKKEFEEELEHLYTYADEVVFNRGYDKGIEDAREKIVGEIDIDSMEDDFSANYVLNPTLVEVDAYRMAIENVLKKIKEG